MSGPRVGAPRCNAEDKEKEGRLGQFLSITEPDIRSGNELRDPALYRSGLVPRCLTMRR